MKTGSWDTPAFWQMVERLRSGDPDAIDPALDFLDEDPWTFRSGYAKEAVAKALCRHVFSRQQQVRAADILLRVLDAGDRWEFRWYCRLAGQLDASLLRDELARRLGSNDSRVVRRALWVLARLRHPHLTAQQQAAARSAVVSLTTPDHRRWRNYTLRNLAVHFVCAGQRPDPTSTPSFQFTIFQSVAPRP